MTHEPIIQIRTKRPNGSIPPDPLYAIDCACGYLSGGNAVWYQSFERAREEFEGHLAEVLAA